MRHSPIIPAALTVTLHPGYPDAIDRLAGLAGQPRPFLRSAWYRAAANCDGQTLTAERSDGSIVAAIPLTRMGPELVGAKGVPGSYWPYRSAVFSPDLQRDELVAMLADPVTAAVLAPLWRIGPANAADPATRMVMEASAMAGWTVLVRELGETWLFDLAGAAQDNGGHWPRKSSRKRLAGYERRLAKEGEVSWLQVSGADWSAEVLEQLGRIEADSWIGRKTDGSGAKFLTSAQRAYWQTALADPVIAEALSATILLLDGRPIAFSFDLRSSGKQYAIAGSYAEDMAAFRIGKIVTYHQLEGALAQGVSLVDLGSGDSGYKREMGAVLGPALIDLLIVRQRKAALLLARKWGQEPANLRRLTLASPHRVDLTMPSLKAFAAAAALAGTAVAVAE